jgi:hypothetical protein
VERCLAERDVRAAVGLLASRPGELLRRLDHLLRLAVASNSTDVVVESLPAAAAQVSPAVLLSALGELRTRDQAWPRRVFLPKGGDAKTHVIDESREPLPPALVQRVTTILTEQVLTRSARLHPVEVAVIDEALDEIIAPFTQRVAARALVTLPRGSAVAIPDSRQLRLFLHWMEVDERVDLDLSAAFFDAGWQHIGTCDYTSLRWQDDAAVHSGDLTSAPPPLGASEFLDLDLAALQAAGARYLVAAVFSYNNIAFEDMAQAYAGIMLRADEPNQGAIFDPGSVEQRFDLAGRSRACIPFVLDLPARSLRWLDVAQGVTGTHHAVHRHHHALARQGQALTELYASGARISMGELARWQAAARARTVLVRRTDERFDGFTRRPDETTAAFADRIQAAEPDSGVDRMPAAELALLYRGDVAVTPGADVYALYPAELAGVNLLAADDVVALLAATADPPAQPAGKVNRDGAS